MKTTVEIADGLLREAKALAAREGTTIRALVEQGLRQIVGSRRTRGKFRLRDASFGGRGLQPGMREGDWEQVRDLIHGERAP